jgi:hypothetical protein
LLVELSGGLVKLIELIFQGAGLFHGGGRVLTRFLERAYLLAEFVAAGFGLLGEGDGFAASLVEGTEIAQKRSGVGPTGTQFFFNKFQVSPDKSQVEHRSFSLLDRVGCGGWPRFLDECERWAGLRQMRRMKGLLRGCFQVTEGQNSKPLSLALTPALL